MNKSSKIPPAITAAVLGTALSAGACTSSSTDVPKTSGLEGLRVHSASYSGFSEDSDTLGEYNEPVITVHMALMRGGVEEILSFDCAVSPRLKKLDGRISMRALLSVDPDRYMEYVDWNKGCTASSFDLNDLQIESP